MAKALINNNLAFVKKVPWNLPKILDLCNQGMTYSFYALVYFIPISIALVESFFGLALLTFFIKRGLTFYIFLKEAPEKKLVYSWYPKLVLFLKSFKPVDNPLNWPMGIFILAGFLSMFVSHYPILSIKGFFFKLLEWTYAYFILIECINSRKRLKILMIFFVLSSTIVNFNGLVQYLMGKEFIFGKELLTGRVSSSFNHPNDFAGYLVVLIPLLFSFLWHYPGGARNRWGGIEIIKQRNPSRIRLLHFLFLILFILALFNMGHTFSRGAWLAFFVTLLYLGIQRGKLVVIPLMIIVVFLSYFSPKLDEIRNVSLLADENSAQREISNQKLKASMFPGQESTSILGNAESRGRIFLESFKNFSGSGRSMFWEDSIMIIRQSPILGMGINTYSQVAKGKGGYPHNCYLQITAEMGLIGLFAFLWLITLLFIESHRRFYKIDDAYLFFVHSGMLAGLLGFLVHSFVDTNFYSVQLGNLMWVAMGIIVAAQKINQRLKDHENLGK